jgi:hypothetical protein
VAACVAGIIPARRAASIDPNAVSENRMSENLRVLRNPENYAMVNVTTPFPSRATWQNPR